MKITSEQEEIIRSLHCERLSATNGNLYDIGSFENTKNSSVADALKGAAFEEDENNKIAYYLVKDSENRILFFFSLKCGLLFDQFIEGERYKQLLDVVSKIEVLVKDPQYSVEERNMFSSLLESFRTKKGVSRDEVARSLSKSGNSHSLEMLFNGSEKHVGATYASIEMVHFCANDDARIIWESYEMPQKMGATLFWYFIVPIVEKVMELVGCEYFFLYAADRSEDQELILYYKENLKFEEVYEHDPAIPLYDFGCKFMVQETQSLSQKKDEFFENFNRDEQAV